MPLAYVAAGSNLGDRQQYLDQAKDQLRKNKQIRFLRSSAVYETDPVGGPPQGKYLNAVWEIETQAAPREVLNELLKIEEQLGRVRSIKNAARTVDLDLLFYGGQVMEEPGLSLPHPRLHEREFVLKPLAELAPDLIHPKLKKTIKDLAKIYANH